MENHQRSDIVPLESKAGVTAWKTRMWASATWEMEMLFSAFLMDMEVRDFYSN
jgi:hypothetical protein